MDQSSSRGPLAGITVIDLTRVASGPYCTMLLADMGARVVKIEQPGRGDDTRGWGPPFQNGESAYFLSVNHGKESVTLNVKHPEGRAVLESLIARADVLVENFRPGVLARLGFGYETLAARFPRLVVCSISGFGQTGRRSNEAGYDAVVQAEAGFMSITGTPEGPPIRPGVPVADLVSGMFAAYGIVLALYARERTGRGQAVDIGMMDAVVALLTYQAALYGATGQAPVRTGNRHPLIAPYETFPASDGEFVLAVGTDGQFRRFCEVAGLDDAAADPRFATNRDRLINYDALKTILSERLRTQTREHWIERLNAVGVPCGSVKSIPEAFADPHLVDREMLLQRPHPAAGLLQVIGVPVKLSGTPGAVRSVPPLLGEHTEAVLAELGIAAAGIQRFREQGVI
jgi:crotonobetainyl-CoA:carnitine CoA-transferase CaiB-like acyl-CoA transferase